MVFTLLFTEVAEATLRALESTPAHAPRCRRLQNALLLLETDPRHPGLRSQPKTGPDGMEVWESFADLRPSGPWPFWWWYGPDDAELTVLAIGPYPE